MEYRELRKALKVKLGAEESMESDHIYYFKMFDDGSYRVGKVSHSARGQVEDFIIRDTARRLRVVREELLELVGCTLDSANHERLWRLRPNWPER